MFGCGTGVVVTSIREIQYENKLYAIPYHPSVLLLRDVLTGMQRGKIETEWSHRIPEWSGGLDAEDSVGGQEAFAG
jgi:branched-chain amino acid aminotransferase